jgi:hypothetical protein
MTGERRGSGFGAWRTRIGVARFARFWRATCGAEYPIMDGVGAKERVKNKFRKLNGLVDVASLNEHEPTEITEILR